jgi:hypothetical protein
MHGNGIGTSEEPAGFLFSRTRTLLAWGILRLLLFVSRTSLSLFFLLFVSLSLDSSWWTFYSSREIVHIVCFYVGRPIYCLISICYFFCLTGFVTAALLFSINKYLFFFLTSCCKLDPPYPLTVLNFYYIEAWWRGGSSSPCSSPASPHFICTHFTCLLALDVVVRIITNHVCFGRH